MERLIINSADDVKAFVEVQEEARQRACNLFIASRAALRVAPYAVEFVELNIRTANLKVKSMVIWRALLTSCASMTSETIDLQQASGAAARIAYQEHVAQYSLALRTKSERSANAIYAAASAAYAADGTIAEIGAAVRATGQFDFWAEVSRDAALWVDLADQDDGTLAITVAPLWSNENPLEHDWHNLREKLLAADTPDERGADWSFWIRWYDDILAGNPQNWDMLHEIATTDAIDWDAPAREVNDRINQIVENYALKNSYYFERIEFSEAKQKLIVVPEGSFDRASVQTAYQRLRDAIEDVRDAPKEGNLDPEYALRDEIRILERTLNRPTTQPIFVVEKCFDCVKRIQARLDDATIFGHDVEDFQKALTRSALDIFGADEDARRIVERRTNENHLSLAKEDRDRLSHFVDEAAPIMDVDLKDDLETDLSGDDDPQTEG